LDANFKNLPEPLGFKIAQAITEYCYLYSGFYIYGRGVLSEQNRLRAAILNLEPAKIVVKIFWKTDRCCISKKKLVKNSIYHFVVTRSPAALVSIRISVAFIDGFSVSFYR
jgi:hypothetical protein